MEATANRLEVPVSTYREWEYGRDLRGHQAYVKMAHIFGVGVQELLVGKKPNRQEIVLKLDTAINQLKELRAEVLSFL